MKKALEKETLVYLAKEKPTYKAASKDYQLMYWIWKVWGLTQWKCASANDLLSFDALKERLGDPNRSLKVKASTIRTLTSEPIHPRHAKMTKKGKQIYKFSKVKVRL